MSRSHLIRVLSSGDILSLTVGAMIGWGWLTLSGQVILQAGSIGSLVALVVGAAGICTVSLVYAELTSTFARSGGEVVFTFVGLGPRIGCLCGWLLLLAYFSICVLQASTVSTLLYSILPGMDVGTVFAFAGWELEAVQAGVGIFATVLIAALSYRSLAGAVLIQFSALILLTLIGVFFFLGSMLNLESSNLQPLMTDLGGFSRALVMVPFFFVGFDIVTQISEESNVPMRSLGRLLILSVLAALVWQLLMHWSVASVLPRDSLASRPLVARDAMSVAWQAPIAGRILLMGGLLAVLTTWNAFFIAITRLVHAMSRARMLPASLGRLHGGKRRPWAVVVCLVGLMTAAQLAGRTVQSWLVPAGIFAIAATYLLVSITFVRLRKSHPRLDRPYAVPFPVQTGWLAIATTAVLVLLHMPGAPAALGWQSWIVLLLWAFLGAYLGRPLLGNLSAAEKSAIQERMLGDPAERVRKMRETLQRVKSM